MTIRLAGLGLLALVLVSCGGGKSSSGSADPSEILARAASRLAATKTFHFRLEHENGTSPLPLNLRLVSAEGDVRAPGSLAADVDARAGSIALKVKIIGIEERTWITNPFTRDWQRLPQGVSVGDIADPGALVANVVKSMRETRVAGQESVDGTATIRLQGRVDSAALRGALPSVDAGYDVAVDVWVGKEDSLPRRVRLKGRLFAEDKSNVVRELFLSRFDAPVDIKPPS